LLAVEAQARDTQRLIAQELNRIGEAARNDYQIARANEQDIAAKLEAARKADDAKNQALIELQDLQRNADAARTIYEQFLRARETIAGEASPGPGARVIAPATPPLSPSSPKTLLVLAIALFSGLFFGAGGAFARDLLAAGPRPVRHDGIETLGVIPRIVPAAGGGLFQRARAWATKTRAEEAATARQSMFLDEIDRRPFSNFSALARRLWGWLAPQDGGVAGRRRVWIVLVTSLSPGVGKTTLASNLARAAARAGARALLIEANPRNPQLWRMIEDEANPGLINVAGVDRVIYRTPDLGQGSLHFIPITPSETRLARRLKNRGSARFDGISGSFDVVVIDGPSAARPEDLRDLGATADRIVLAIRPDEHDEVEDFIADFDLSEHQNAAGIVTIVEDLSEAA
jgi:Mrp family chromosome partitioning ATPase